MLHLSLACKQHPPEIMTSIISNNIIYQRQPKPKDLNSLKRPAQFWSRPDPPFTKQSISCNWQSITPYRLAELQLRRSYAAHLRPACMPNSWLASGRCLNQKQKKKRTKKRNRTEPKNGSSFARSPGSFSVASVHNMTLYSEWWVINRKVWAGAMAAKYRCNFSQQIVVSPQSTPSVLFM